MSKYHGKIVLAIDPGSQHVGWCWGEGRDYGASGRHSFRGADAWDRLPEIFRWLWSLARVVNPDVLAVEEPIPVGFHRNPDTDRKIITAFAGPFYLGSVILGIDVIRVSPVRIRKTGYHKKDPESVADFIEQQTGIRPDKVSEDHADAVGCWAWVVGRHSGELAAEQSRMIFETEQEGGENR